MVLDVLYWYFFLIYLELVCFLADQFIACAKSRDKAHELASLIWLAVIDNMEENEQTLLILKRLASEGDVSKYHTNIPLS